MVNFKLPPEFQSSLRRTNSMKRLVLAASIFSSSAYADPLGSPQAGPEGTKGAISHQGGASDPSSAAESTPPFTVISSEQSGSINSLVASAWKNSTQGTGGNATTDAFSPANSALWLAGSLTGTGDGPYGLMSIADAASSPLSDHWVSGFWIAHKVGSGAGEGSRVALRPILTIASNLPCMSGGSTCFHIASFPQTYVNANLGGTAGPRNSRGDAYGGASLAQLGSGATYVHSAIGHENNVSAQAGASVDYKSVASFISVNGDAVGGSIFSSMIFFAADSTTTYRWPLGITFGTPLALWPFNANSTLIGSVAPSTGSRVARYGVDFSGVNFGSGCSFKSNSFCVPQAGVASGILQADESGTVSTAASNGAWTSYTPTLSCGSGALTRASASGHYWQIGKTVSFEVTAVIVANGTCATSLSFTLPAPATATHHSVAAGRNYTSGKMLQGMILAGSSTTEALNYDNTYPGADGYAVVLSGTYEAQ